MLISHYMKPIWLLTVGLYLICSAAVAGIYKGTDANGNIYYSDQPIENSVKYTPRTISVVDSTKVTADDKSADQKSSDFKYSRFAIVDPVNNQVIRNASNVTVGLQIAPPLNVEQDHTVSLLVDGKPVVKDSQKMSLQTGRLDRGAHRLQAQVKDSKGKIVIQSKPVTAHIKQGAR